MKAGCSHVITIDGLAGSGKTTLSTQLAERIGCQVFSTGVVYRLLGALALQTSASLEDEQALVKLVTSRITVI